VDVSLRRLLLLSALLSANDTYGGDYFSAGHAFSGVHPSHLQNFTRLILRSDASFESNASFSTGHLMHLLLTGVDALLNPPNLRKIPDMALEELLTDVFSLMWRQQARLDGRQVLVLNRGRAHAVLVHFPDLIAVDLKAKQKTGYVHLDTYFKSEFGCSIDTLLMGLVFIYHRYREIFNGHSVFNPVWLQTQRQETPDQPLSIGALERYLTDATPALEDLTIDPQDLTDYLGRFLPVAEVQPLLTLLSASIEELRGLMVESPYSSGVMTYAPLPLELKPFVLLPDGRYVLPNLRSLLTSMSRLPLVLLARSGDNNVLTCYGAGLEEYTFAMTSDRVSASGTTAAAEFEYAHPDTGKPVKSADITLLEPGQRRVLVEVKAARVPEYGLALPGTAAVVNLDQLVTKTVLKGIDKASHLDTRPPPTHPKAVADTLPDDPLVVVVYGETFENFDGVFRLRINADADHPLRPHLGSFLALSIEEYEHHLEVARERKVSVISLLIQSAVEFRDRGPLQLVNHQHLGTAWPRDPYVDQFEDELIQKFPSSHPKLADPASVTSEPH